MRYAQCKLVLLCTYVCKFMNIVTLNRFIR